MTTLGITLTIVLGAMLIDRWLKSDSWGIVTVLFTIFLLTLLLGTRLAHAEPGIHWVRVATPVVPYAIEVHEVTRGQLAKIKREYDQYQFQQASLLRRATEDGFAILSHINDVWRCRIYVLDRDNVALMQHELKHCEGYTHE